MTSSLFYLSDDIIWHHYCVLLHHNHTIAHHSFIIHANGLLIYSLWWFYAFYGTFYVYKDKQSFTYKYWVIRYSLVSFYSSSNTLLWTMESWHEPFILTVWAVLVLPRFVFKDPTLALIGAIGIVIKTLITTTVLFSVEIVAYIRIAWIIIILICFLPQILLLFLPYRLSPFPNYSSSYSLSVPPIHPGISSTIHLSFQYSNLHWYSALLWPPPSSIRQNSPLWPLFQFAQIL